MSAQLRLLARPPVADDPDPGYRLSTSRRPGLTDGDPEPGVVGGGTSAAPGSLVRLPPPVQLDLTAGLTVCANPGCGTKFGQARTGRRRRTCSSRCRKRVQLDRERGPR